MESLRPQSPRHEEVAGLIRRKALEWQSNTGDSEAALLAAFESQAMLIELLRAKLQAKERERKAAEDEAANLAYKLEAISSFLNLPLPNDDDTFRLPPAMTDAEEGEEGYSEC